MLVTASDMETRTADEIDELVREVNKEVVEVVPSSPRFPPMSLDVDC